METFIHESVRDLPVAGEYDVIVAGSGPAGVSAAINAGRRGAKGLLLEWNNAVGGISTSGLMSHFIGGNIVVDRIEQDTVHLERDLRDTEDDWFYRAFCVEGRLDGH